MEIRISIPNLNHCFLDNHNDKLILSPRNIESPTFRSDSHSPFRTQNNSIHQLPTISNSDLTPPLPSSPGNCSDELVTFSLCLPYITAFTNTSQKSLCFNTTTTSPWPSPSDLPCASDFSFTSIEFSDFQLTLLS
ncbi:hypothetical protein Fot_19245 [Forsythia ovata]|uniref:Uncharacterized protein n=1 Tax=Forsythia ovata TaxID=205694 RepID=A0ABD1VKG9_9LAMI